MLSAISCCWTFKSSTLLADWGIIVSTPSTSSGEYSLWPARSVWMVAKELMEILPSWAHRHPLPGLQALFKIAFLAAWSSLANDLLCWQWIHSRTSSVRHFNVQRLMSTSFFSKKSNGLSDQSSHGPRHRPQHEEWANLSTLTVFGN